MSAITDQNTTDLTTRPDRPTATAQSLNQAWCDAFNAGDLDLLVSMYEPDAVLVPGPGAAPVRGHAAIRAALLPFLGLGGRLRFSPRFWLVHDEVAMGSIAFVMDGGQDPDGRPVDLHGITAEVARRQSDGTWKYLVDHPFGGSE